MTNNNEWKSYTCGGGKVVHEENEKDKVQLHAGTAKRSFMLHHNYSFLLEVKAKSHQAKHKT